MTEFVDSLPDVFVLFGNIRTKRMFGGYGIYRDGQMFAIVVDDVLFLKAPDEIFDDPGQTKYWADRAYRAGLQARPSGRASAGRRL